MEFKILVLSAQLLYLLCHLPISSLESVFLRIPRTRVKYPSDYPKMEIPLERTRRLSEYALHYDFIDKDIIIRLPGRPQQNVPTIIS